MKADNYVPSTEKMKKRKYYIGSDEVITAKLSVLLDKYSISNRDVIRIISATTEALDHDPPMQIVSISVKQQFHKKKRTELIKNRFKYFDFNGTVVHWDNKLFLDTLNKDNLERVPILISCNGDEQLIGVPQLEKVWEYLRRKLYF